MAKFKKKEQPVKKKTLVQKLKSKVKSSTRKKSKQDDK